MDQYNYGLKGANKYYLYKYGEKYKKTYICAFFNIFNEFMGRLIRY